MNTFQSTMSSPRNQRILFFVGLAVLAAGIVFLVFKFVGGSDSTKVAPDKGFKPQIQPKTQPLKTSEGATVTTYGQLSPQVKEAIRGFILVGVLNGNYGASYKYTAPSLTRGVSQQKWANAAGHPIIPLPGYTLNGATFKLFEASSKEVLVDVTMQPESASVGRPVPMRIGLAPYGTGADQKWLVSYWMPASNEAAVPYGG